MSNIRILGISVFDRIKESGKVQKVLTSNAKAIKTRLGFHELNADVCSRHGFIILELKGDEKQWIVFENELNSIEGIQVKTMNFKI